MSRQWRGCWLLLALVAASASTAENQCPAPVRDCSELGDGEVSGVHLVSPGLRHPVPALCDRGWTVFQRRANIRPRQNFFLGWQAYKWGFGRLQGEFWWGLEHLWRVTALLDRRYELRVELEDFENRTSYALYREFSVSPEEDGYRLTVANYSGTATDALSPQHSGMRFSTKDRDNDNSNENCAQYFRAAWWYRHCFESSLNGPYREEGSSEAVKDKNDVRFGILWNTWTLKSLKSVTMKIRPTKTS